jgi:hypothetical protein
MTSDVQLELTPSVEKFAYLCVFNSGSWKAIQWGELNDNVANFREMGRDILYLPAFYIEEELVPAGLPFILHKDSSTRAITNEGDKVTISASDSTSDTVTYEGMTDESITVPLKVGADYLLQEWVDGDWKEISTAIGSEHPMQFNALTSGGLYWLIEVDGDKEERPFTIENGKLVRW